MKKAIENVTKEVVRVVEADTDEEYADTSTRMMACKLLYILEQGPPKQGRHGEVEVWLLGSISMQVQTQVQ